ncbi:helix-turn-helix domain-containing protein [Massilimicrobiota sp. SW1139]|uniref:helix-turn-helix domain-containing protein n=1 Tax=Massilimicrobiota sp. SW1139 TaxID=2530043 RepID=UPI001438D781|nr:helix-turn-helix transcriptional regulator [Massilimicrobiota sp. SW1139]
MLLRRINDLRIDNDLSIAQLARNINVSPRSLQYYLKGQYELPIPILLDIANYFNVSTDYLLGRTDNKEINR